MNNPGSGSEEQFKADLARLREYETQEKYRYNDVEKASYLKERYGLDWSDRFNNAVIASNGDPRAVASSVAGMQQLSLGDYVPLTGEQSLEAMNKSIAEEDKSMSQDAYSLVKAGSRAGFAAIEAPVQVVQNTLTKTVKEMKEAVDSKNPAEMLKAASTGVGMTLVDNGGEVFTNTDIAVQVGTAMKEGVDKGFGKEGTGDGFFISEDSSVAHEKEMRAREQWTLENGEAATFGRAVMSEVLDFDKDSNWYKLGSGMVDFGVAVGLDPLNLIAPAKAGKEVAKGAKIMNQLSDVAGDLTRLGTEDIAVALDDKAAAASTLYRHAQLRLQEELENNGLAESAFKGLSNQAAEVLTNSKSADLAASDLDDKIRLGTKKEKVQYLKEIHYADFKTRVYAELSKKEKESVDLIDVAERKFAKAQEEARIERLDALRKVHEYNNAPPKPKEGEVVDDVFAQDVDVEFMAPEHYVKRVEELEREQVQALKQAKTPVEEIDIKEAYTVKLTQLSEQHKKTYGSSIGEEPVIPEQFKGDFKKVSLREKNIDKAQAEFVNAMQRHESILSDKRAALSGHEESSKLIEDLVEKADVARTAYVERVAELTGKHVDEVKTSQDHWDKLSRVRIGMQDNAVNADKVLNEVMFGSIGAKMHDVVAAIDDPFTLRALFNGQLSDDALRALSTTKDANVVKAVLVHELVNGDVNQFNNKMMKRAMRKAKGDNDLLTNYLLDSTTRYMSKAERRMTKLSYVDLSDSKSVLTEMDNTIGYLGKDLIKDQKELAKFNQHWQNKMIRYGTTQSGRKKVLLEFNLAAINRLPIDNTTEAGKKLIDQIKKDINYNFNYQKIEGQNEPGRRIIKTEATKGGVNRSMLGERTSEEIGSVDNPNIESADFLNMNAPSIDYRALKRVLHAAGTYDQNKGVYVFKNGYRIVNDSYDKFVKPTMLTFRLGYTLMNTVEGATRNLVTGNTNMFSNPEIMFQAAASIIEKPDTRLGKLAARFSKTKYDVEGNDMFDAAVRTALTEWAIDRTRGDILAQVIDKDWFREIDRTLNTSELTKNKKMKDLGYLIANYDDYVAKGAQEEYFKKLADAVIAKTTAEPLFASVLEYVTAYKPGDLEFVIVNKPGEDVASKLSSGEKLISDVRVTQLADQPGWLQDHAAVAVKDGRFKNKAITPEAVFIDFFENGPGRQIFEELYNAKYVTDTEVVAGGMKTTTVPLTGKLIFDELIAEDNPGNILSQVKLMTNNLDPTITTPIKRWKYGTQMFEDYIKTGLTAAEKRHYERAGKRKFPKDKDGKFIKDMTMEDGTVVSLSDSKHVINYVAKAFKDSVTDKDGVVKVENVPQKVPYLPASDVSKAAEKVPFSDKYADLIQKSMSILSTPERKVAHLPYLTDQYTINAVKFISLLSKDDAVKAAANIRLNYKGFGRTPPKVRAALKQLDKEVGKAKGYSEYRLSDLHEAASKNTLHDFKQQFYGVEGRTQLAAQFSILAPFVQAAINTGMFYGRQALKPENLNKWNKAQMAYTNAQTEDSSVLREVLPNTGVDTTKPLIWYNEYTKQKMITIPFLGFNVDTAQWNPLTYTNSPAQIFGPGVTAPAALVDAHLYTVPDDYRQLLLGNEMTDPDKDVAFLRSQLPTAAQQLWKLWESTASENICADIEAVLASDPNAYYSTDEFGNIYLTDEATARAIEEAKKHSFWQTLQQAVRTNIMRGGTSSEEYFVDKSGNEVLNATVSKEFWDFVQENPTKRNEALMNTLDKYGPQAMGLLTSVYKTKYDGSSRAFDFAKSNPTAFNEANDLIGLMFPNNPNEPDSDWARMVNDTVHDGIAKTPQQLQGDINIALMRAQQQRIIEKYEQGFITENVMDIALDTITDAYKVVNDKSAVTNKQDTTYSKVKGLMKYPEIQDTDAGKMFTKLDKLRQYFIDSGTITGDSFSGEQPGEPEARAAMLQYGEQLLKEYPQARNLWYYELRKEYSDG